MATLEASATAVGRIAVFELLFMIYSAVSLFSCSMPLRVGLPSWGSCDARRCASRQNMLGAFFSRRNDSRIERNIDPAARLAIVPINGEAQLDISFR